MDQFFQNKKVGIGIFIAVILLGIIGLALSANNAPSTPTPVPTVPVSYPTNIPTNRPMKMETFYLTPTPLP